ncbi:uncharacterized protein PG986_007464 [Apiospora aurea]|uniref:Uncharacterized protein n=1 Tax=Apiospora aurea TaxID=335848 RepID=A0ABR1QDF8_9PEZI
MRQVETPRNRPTNQPTPPPSGRAENHKDGTSGFQPLGKGREESPSPAATGPSRYSPELPPGLVEYRRLPATPHPMSCQGFGDVEGTFMHPGGDEEEKALFKDGSQSTIIVAFPYSNKTPLPLSRPRLDGVAAYPRGTTEEGVMPSITRVNLEYVRMEQMMMLSMGHTPPPPVPSLRYNHVLGRLPVDSIPMNRPNSNPTRLIWGNSPLWMVTSLEDLP